MSGSGRVVIGVSGKIGHGKDSVADVLVRSRGFVKACFADALKDEVVARLPRTLRAIEKLSGRMPADLNYLVRIAKPPGVRELLQEYGTEVRRADDPEYWVQKWCERVSALPSDARVVVPDMRFQNEHSVVTGMPWRGYTLRVVRLLGGRKDEHTSETDLDAARFDHVLMNSGSLEDLARGVESWVDSVL